MKVFDITIPESRTQATSTNTLDGWKLARLGRLGAFFHGEVPHTLALHTIMQIVNVFSTNDILKKYLKENEALQVVLMAVSKVVTPLFASYLVTWF